SHIHTHEIRRRPYSPGSAIPFDNIAGELGEAISRRAEGRQAATGFLAQPLRPPAALLDAEQSRVSQLTAIGVLLHPLSRPLRRPLDVEQVVGDLKRLAETPAVVVEAPQQIGAA